LKRKKSEKIEASRMDHCVHEFLGQDAMLSDRSKIQRVRILRKAAPDHYTYADFSGFTSR
jgi:hypothetical protein